MEQKTEASKAVDELDALAKRLDRIHTACCDDRPKQAVGEMIHAMINMPEWSRVRASLKAQPAPTEAQSEPVMWLEAEASAKGQPLRHVVGSMLFSTRMHTTKPEVLNNALWPLYEHPVPTEAQGEDSTRLDAERYQWLCDEYGITWLPCFLEHHLSCGYVADGKESVDDTIDRARASAETGGVE